MTKTNLKVVPARRPAAEDWDDLAGTANYRAWLKDPKRSGKGDWHEYLDETGKSPRTVETYLEALKDFRRWLEGSGRDLGPLDVEADDVRAYTSQQKKDGKSGSTISIRFLALSAFYHWLVEEELLLPASPLKGLKCPRPGEQRPLQLIPDEVLLALVNDCQNDVSRPSPAGGRILRGGRVATVGTRFKGLRDLAMFHCFIDTPGRLREILALTTGDVDLDNMQLTVRAKGGGFRVMPFGDEAYKALKNYKRARDRHGFAHLPDFWLSREGPFVAAYAMFKARASAVGHPELHPHDMRKTFAVGQLEEGEDPAYVQRIAGWRSNKMLNHYVGASMQGLAIKSYRRRGSPMDRLAGKGSAKTK